MTAGNNADFLDQLSRDKRAAGQPQVVVENASEPAAKPDTTTPTENPAPETAAAAKTPPARKGTASQT